MERDPYVGKKRIPMQVVVLIACMLMSSVTVYFALHPLLLTPQLALNAYCTALKTGDARTLYNLQPDPKQDIKYIQTAVKLTHDIGGLKSCTLMTLRQNGYVAVAFVTFTYNDGVKVSLPLYLKRDENGIWGFTRAFQFS